MTERTDALRRLEREVSVMIRRVRRVIGERARAVHPDLQPSTYLMLAYLVEQGPVRASAMSAVFDIDKGAISRQVQTLLDLGLVDRTPDPEDGRATLVSVSEEGSPTDVAGRGPAPPAARRAAVRLDGGGPGRVHRRAAALQRDPRLGSRLSDHPALSRCAATPRCRAAVGRPPGRC
ncbi:MarR family transcriptional regulator [Nocardioides sp. TF02-7]|uniref:MarR family winged helix-turn-helix transcriptional regulator n=1 Tax=Nocardioides sp. TF02-7 TaxID=2917724 RepID=UPI001F06FAF8|nr:MarR family transcriptional regulator [Nocardioides sp. TF02-7]UMG93738.1 MarR family transcriptional regulator [Nocardioides sp. TF02-7]